ncbi:A24 family peptidase [Aestuariibacter sp. AA17]|uniref:Prepilin leader peptidase/N-methyltransferase n=1 Tax=Fluctibacter corallii TaxID=2984329 RepID=A0ABT3A9G7_9ALTE|nr:A24 family peptidase [Aestuariibacter sp. AA17]MCV2884917.1 A24 family peptidase [Aestuariibacter sp. AA17]
MNEVLILMESSPVFFLGIVFVTSLMVGSFLNVVIYRLPIMMEREWKEAYQAHFHPDTDADSSPPFNLVKPDSTCPACGHKIRVWENIPVLSWLILRGKCSQCHAPISVRYPAVELLTAVISTITASHFGFSTEAFFAVLFTWSLVALIFIDTDKMLLPDQITLPLIWVGLLLSLHHVYVSPNDAIWGAVAGYLSLWSVYWLFKIVTGKEGMGFGDFKLLAAIGAWVGWQHLPTVILMSSAVGAVIGIAMLKFQKKDQSQPIPFGPYLAIAGWITLLYGETLANAYWQWVLA